MTPADLLTLGGAAIVVAIVVEVLKRALGWSGATVDRFGPLLAVVVGTLIVGLAGALQGADPLASTLTGLLAGASAVGLYDVGNAPNRSSVP